MQFPEIGNEMFGQLLASIEMAEQGDGRAQLDRPFGPHAQSMATAAQKARCECQVRKDRWPDLPEKLV
jgi:hypothetical protein